MRCERPLQEHLQLDHFLSHNGSLSVLPTIRASDEELTWFGKNNSLTHTVTDQHYNERHQPEHGARQPAGRLLWRQAGTQEVSHGGQCAGGYL